MNLTIQALLQDYAKLLRWLANGRDHDGSTDQVSCGGLGRCKKCDMLKKADEVDARAILLEKLVA